MRKWLRATYRAGLAVSLAVTVLTAAGELPAHGAAATPPGGYGAGAGYCTSYAGGAASAYSFDGVYACQGSTVGATTFDNPGGTYAWQCVELSARFLWAAYGIWAGPGLVGSGASLVQDVHKEHPEIPTDSPQPRHVPVAGDVISLGPGGGSNSVSGHTAVVVSANAATGQFTIMSENDPERAAGEQTLKVDLSGGHNNYVFYHGIWTAAEWLRLRYYGDIVQWAGDPNTQKAAWRVGADGRRHGIPSISDFWCLYNGGVPGPYVLSTAEMAAAPFDNGSQAPCGGDVNGDGIVDVYDLSILLSQWGLTGGATADINLDGRVDIFDLSMLLSQWGQRPSPYMVTMPGAVRSAAAAIRATSRSAALARPVQGNGMAGLAGDNASVNPSVSGDGNLVVFGSLASNLVPNDTNGVLDVFAWNRSTGTIRLVSANGNGSQLTTASNDPRVSPNGRYVAFDSGGDVYVKDLQTGALTRISQPNGNPGSEPDSPAYADAVSSSGLVIFESKAANLVVGDTNGMSDVFARQLAGGPIELVSTADGTSAAGGYSGTVSDDGRYVAFASTASSLASGNTSGQVGIFVRDRVLGTTFLISAPPGGGQADGDASFPSISADGTSVAFSSTATNLAAGNPAGRQQVYVRDLATAALDRVSQANDGAAGNADSTEPVLSGDGSRVAFRSQASNLVAGDTNNADDVFVQDLATHLISRVNVTSSLGQASSSSFRPSLSGNGTVIAFPSDAANLTGLPTGSPEQIVAHAITQLPLSGGRPTISGTAQVGRALAVVPGTWGPAGVALKYQWYAAGTVITGATALTLNLTAAQYGKAITVKVTASRAGYATITLASRATAIVAAGTLTAPTPTITGIVRAGATLTANAGAWQPAGVTLTYQWYVNGNPVTSGTARTLTLSSAWVGRIVTVKVAGRKTGYVTTSRTSKPTPPIAA
jgi:hypothetical protein